MCDLLTYPYIAELRPMQDAVQQTLSSATAGPSRDAAEDFHPLDRAVAGDSINDGATS